MVGGFNESLPVKGSSWGIKRILRVDKAYLEKYDLSLSGIKKRLSRESLQTLSKLFRETSKNFLRVSYKHVQ